jgi:capsular polysaccharide transport system permease protein
MLEKTAAEEVATPFVQKFASLVQQPASRGSLEVGGFKHWLRASIARRFLTLGRMSFALVVILPTYCTSFYSLVLASNRYVSEFRVAVRSIERQKTGGLSDLLGFGGVSPTGNDSYAVVQYLQSRQAIADLGGAKAVGKLFDGNYVDWFSRLDADAPIESLTRYWNRMVEAVYENSTGTIIVRVATFEPGDSKGVAKLLLKNSESLVNRMSDRAHHDSVDFAEKEVTEAQARLDGVREKIRNLQNREAILDPSKSAETTLAIAAKLKEQIARLSAELITQRSRLSEAAPSVIASRNTIMGLQRELASVEGEATSTGGRSAGPGQPARDRPLTSVLGAFQQLADDKTFAEKAYLSTLSALETAKMDAAKQQIYLATIVPPDLPEEPSFPKPLRQILIVIGVASALWLIGLLGVHTVREHA